jgi:hypothetical protein
LKNQIQIYKLSCNEIKSLAQIETEILFIFSSKMKRLQCKAGPKLQKSKLAKQIDSDCHDTHNDNK